MSTIAARLKESTRDAHNSAEGNNFQREMFSGTLPLPQYRHYLGQLFLVHQALEQGMEQQPYMSAVVTAEQFQTEFLRRDLAALSQQDDDVKPLPATREMLSKIEKANRHEPVALLGYHYVLLGSKHGGKMIASVIKKAYALPSDGAVYFDPYGPEFQQHWKHFVSGMNELSLTEKQEEAIFTAAREMFAYVGEMGGQIISVKV